VKAGMIMITMTPSTRTHVILKAANLFPQHERFHRNCHNFSVYRCQSSNAITMKIPSTVGFLVLCVSTVDAFSCEMSLWSLSTKHSAPSRRSFLSTTVATVGAVASAVSLQPVKRADAAASSPSIFKLNSGVTYATLKEGKGSFPQPGDIVAIEYTGYLTTGAIFDKTHSEGSQNALLFKLGR
jgi:hypothetical protein